MRHAAIYKKGTDRPGYIGPRMDSPRLGHTSRLGIGFQFFLFYLHFWPIIQLDSRTLNKYLEKIYN
jgi:hypothetical protein